MLYLCAGGDSYLFGADALNTIWHDSAGVTADLLAHHPLPSLLF